MEKEVIIVGAGLVGSLWAVYLTNAGYKVRIYESRSDIRKAEIKAGKSINLALSDRGWNALEHAGISGEIQPIAIPMSGRIMHSLKGDLTYQPYGKENQAIYSVSRGDLNKKMVEIATQKGAEIYYNEKCIDLDSHKGTITFENTQTKELQTIHSKLIFGADGAFSKVRYAGLQKLPRFNYSQKYIEDGYKELLLPANEDGSYKLDKNALHIWPRGRFMLIALPNDDGSFTCTLFMPYEGDKNAFESLDTDEKVIEFFKTTFPDFYEIMPNLLEDWHQHPLSGLAIIRCFPWTNHTTALIGDAAHATVPFYGQGMNSGFEDCYVLNTLMEEHNHNWDTIFKSYEKLRKPDGDAIQDLSLHNYYVMRDYVADPKFLLQKKIEAHIFEKHPEKWMPLYSQVTFSHIRYSKAWKVGMQQEAIMKEIIELPEIEEKWNSKEIEQIILEKLDNISE
ncbi:MAG: FAD-dependent monooxygenase [Flavobacteriales bacterium]|jgi:kynurenine 3-monooxygenase|nr:FAD-dependent monooxygenase [Flavobacteriales bacterium]